MTMLEKLRLLADTEQRNRERLEAWKRGQDARKEGKGG